MFEDYKANHHFWSFVLLTIFRYGQKVDRLKLPKVLKFLFLLPYYILNLVIVEGFLHCHFPLSISLGKGVALFHPYEIMLNRHAIIGEHVIIRNGVTIGVKRQGEYCQAEIGDRVDIGTGAKIIGSVKIGENSIIGANSVVITSFEENSIIVGVPAINKKI
ncbi:hypothetical protein NE298_12235 [Lactococcus lactis]|uniref:Serine acetyltransferase n=1 Tax=Lactococcus lactis subsp. lactis TaxID=1360 RepID=A0A1V0NCH2_LACLL|nr:hypothetical protein [Lactococcus lactis]MRL86579.1 serine acetyltransferase [Lactococcus cremoris]ARD97620.1 Galactoside O-acetyltransferase [Lactococcus lactis subsp. lactis]MCM6847483.1 hypothetical protein [Lactococcus lactis]MCT0027568.1 serine acetyltransferase [Lactococcus lactis subsp. lactis]MCT3105607.1 serine acetyltransferase [Lactococcus lactis]